ncbi:hypothetical protein [uncultured Polaribacter sp.]|uniref:hypothetical protein n=1 Tax=uncultured Polaribacter sp. TaxID=174711 RepID=UPI0026285B0F|nr:hypothetical protein [uncultured Polaribacter sp.]
MKKITSVFVLLLAIITISSCSSSSDSNNEPAFILSNTNIVGSYAITNLNISTDITTTSNGFPIKVATATTEGDLFKLNLELAANGTYTMVGSYTILYKLDPVVGDSFEERDIIEDIDFAGTFSVNEADNTITFSGGLLPNLSGTLEVKNFNEDSFSLYQEIEVPVNSNVEEVTTYITFERI